MAFDKWDARFIEMTDLIATWASCFAENRKMGAVIVRNKRVLTTGYNGAPAGIRPCVEKGFCIRQQLSIPSGQRAELCFAVHAEQNALVQAAKLGVSVEGATLYCSFSPCSVCAKLIINAGIARLVYKNEYPDAFSSELLREGGVLCEQFDRGNMATPGDAAPPAI